MALISSRKFEQAATELQIAAKDRPGAFAAHNALGIAYRSLGNPGEAAEEFKKTLALNPGFVDASLNLADLALEQKREVAAISYLQQALAKAPPQPFAERLQVELGAAYFQNRDYEKAAGVVKKLLATHPGSAQLHFNLANSYVHYDEWAKAPAEYKEVLRLEPHNESARLSLAKAYLSRNQADESLPYVGDYIRNRPEDPEGYEIEGEAYRKLGRFADAVPVLRRAVAMDGKSYEAHYNLGLSLARLGQTEEGIKQLREAAQLKPEAPEAAYELGLLLSKSGSAQAGQSEFQKLQAVKEEGRRASRADTVEYLARFNQLENQRQLSDWAQRLGNFGLEAYNARNWTQAIEDLKDALQIRGDCRFSADLHRNLGLVYCHKSRRFGPSVEGAPGNPA
ncbi:MAG: tetratricopeptide repeat protein [Terriglobia bacterium]